MEARPCCVFFFSSRRRHTRFDCDWSSDVCSSDLISLRLHHVVHWRCAVLPPRPRDGRMPCDQVVISLSWDAARTIKMRFRKLNSILTDRKSTRLNSSHSQISYAVFCLKKKKKTHI